VTARAAADLPWHNGVAVVTMAKGGLMYEASVGGQKFSYKPLENTESKNNESKSGEKN
jgi:hypothetical protein